MSDDDASPLGPDPRITRAIKFMQRVVESDSHNRTNAEMWRKFRDGDQWPAEIQNQRQLERRPCITVNKIEAYCEKVENQQRQQRPRIKVEPTGGRASKRDAQVIQGMCRHVETNDGGGDMAYDTGFSYAATEGRGYWRIMSRYVRDEGFEQELYLMQIDDPLSVYYDDNSIMPDGSDATECLIVSEMAKDAFRAQYPGANDGANFQSTGLGAGWVMKDRIRVAEHFYIELRERELCRLSDGTVAWKDELPATEVLEAAGVQVRDTRKVPIKQVRWCKITAMDVLEERDLPGKYIPVIPCYGRIKVIDSKRKYSGLVKNAVGPATMSNFWKTAMAETVALAPKAKWILASGSDEGHVNEWAQANQSAKATLRWKHKDAGGEPFPAPFRVQPEPPPEGAMAMAQSVDQDISTVLGIIEPAMRIRGNVSGKALQAERLQSEENTFNFYDNMTRSIAFTGRQLVDLLPHYYPEPGRVVRIVGDDGRSKTATLNAPDPQSPDSVIHDMSVREYEIVMDTGPGYNTKRQEAVESMTPLFEADPKLMEVAGDVYFRNMDWPGADVIADRLAAANPLSEIDEESQVPPQAQVMIKSLQQKLQQASQQMQQMALEIKFGTQGKLALEAERQKGENVRTHMKETVKAHGIEVGAATRQEDVHTRALATVGAAEIHEVGAIIQQTKEHGHEKDLALFQRAAAKEDQQISTTEAS